ncbi:flavohemoglobin expression-modulating QEGLA motif protein [Fulvivirga kasyanovii]|uniref:DUF1704 domain-containing protein n=1 Tax=Fulvivirga kasyanovii TaxID=396812 RepID=A0ABW9RY65_9BACT|nr:tyrosine/phenylalanine carboxypeptidase domain-containing protein [Fulvivirga kasyanovii]MTI29168.1 DUF1704 domain-containing protein [Fulvivirga kasyanovii]
MIDQSLIRSVCKSLKRGKSVNRNLPHDGKIVIDQLLPYLCIYRYPEEGKDHYLAGLLRTQAAYILVRQDIDIHELLSSVANSISAQYKAVLLIEMWPGKDGDHEVFKVLSPSEKAPATTKALTEGLEDIRFDYPQITVETHDTKERHPEGLVPLLSIEQSKEVGGLLIGLEIPPIYHDADKEHFALLYRKLRSRISRVLKKAAFEFIRVQAGNEFSHYLMLGKTRLTKLVRSADRRLAEVSERMNFLLRVTPVNDVAAWEKFKEDKFKKVPSFNYRLIPLDPELEKRKLYDIKLEQIDDPTLTLLLRNKRKELELQLTMLEARQMNSFRHLSQSLFGEVPQSTKQLARTILEETSPDDTREKVPMHSEEFASLACDEVGIYARQFPELKIGVEIRHDISGLMVSKSNLLVSDTLEIDAFRAEALIQHEVGTHILTYCNGRRQPLQQMYAGLDGYDQLQEGLAVLNEYLAGGLTAGRLRLLAARVIAADMMVRDVDFIETFNYLHEELKFTKHTAFDITTRIFRGGGFTKDSVYLRGLEQLLEFLKKGGRLKTLYIGKFDLKHVDLIEELVHRNVLNEPFLPPMLEKESVKERIDKVRKGLTPLELLTHSITKNEYESRIYN